MRQNRQSVAYKQNNINNKNNNLKVIKSKSVKILGFAPFQAIMLLMIIIIMISYLIYNKVLLDKIGNEIVKYQKDYEEAVSEQVRLEVEMESKISLKKLEEIAREKGLGPVQDYQIEYIDFKKQDNIEIVDGGNKNKKSIKNFLNNILSYLR
ncbi:MAG: hypothetical protein J6C55_01820 [Oscillospiraceae bacterium]|nr:hypothetical protein [Oscillospiraceae bacterium]